MSACVVCSATTDAMLCWSCTVELERVIAELPGELEDLQRAATRQVSAPMGLGRGRQWDEPPRGPIVGSDGRPLPAALRSRHGQIALPATPWPFAPGPADQLWAARNTMTTWARHLLEACGLDPAVVEQPCLIGPTCPPHRHNRGRLSGVPFCDRDCVATRCGHETCAEIRSTPERPAPLDVPRWLLANLDAIRLDEAAAEIHADLFGLHDENLRWIVGDAPADVYAGTCDASDVRVAVVDGVVTPTVGTCGADLYGRDGDSKVSCPHCGARYPIAEHKAKLREAVDDQWARPQTIADSLTTLDEPVNSATLRKWIERDAKLGRRTVDYPVILQRGIDDDAHPLYHVGDVRARLAWSRANATRGRFTAA